MIEHFFCYNDKFYPAGTSVISPGNRSLRYGDGLFETMKMVNEKIINKDFHFERLFNGLQTLQFNIPKNFTPSFLEKKLRETAAKNNHNNTARMRLMIFRGNGGIFDPKNLLPNYIIETWPLSDSYFNENGLAIDIFPGAKKSCDIFSNLKSNNYLPYVMAGLFAKKNNLNDCMVLNSFDRICDSAIANVFIVKGNTIYTPPLAEGCVAGVMRRWLLEKFNDVKHPVIEKNISENDLLNADEIFLTNAISYLRWVANFREKNYSNKITRSIYDHIIQTI
jgi:branched-chain amino acid aminotransferase